mgnify:CR=1 FL=1
MLARLALRNLALVESAELEFSEGLNVLTGETGAGKSVLVHALGLAMGERARGDVIREGCDQAEVEAIFELARNSAVVDRLQGAALLEGTEDGPPDRIVLIVRRLIRRGRTGRILVNGRSVTLAELRTLVAGLVDVGSQHQQLALRQAQTPLRLLDDVCDGGRGRAEVERAYHVQQEALDGLERQRGTANERLERQDYLLFLLDELEELDPQPGEQEVLEARRRRLAHATALVEGLSATDHDLTGDDHGVLTILGQAVRRLERLGAIDPGLESFAVRLETARLELEDLSRDLMGSLGELNDDPRELAAVEERLDRLRTLARKHKVEPEGLVSCREALRQELEAITHIDEVIEAAERELEAATVALQDRCGVLSAERAAAAQRLGMDRVATAGAEATDDHTGHQGDPFRTLGRTFP